MHELYELKDKLLRELEEYGKQELTTGSLEVVDKLSHAIKNLCKILESYEMEEERQSSMRDGGGGGSSRYAREDGGSSNRYAREGGSSRRYSSYARGRTGNVRRDSMGRYARNDGIEELVESVRDMMQDLPQNLQTDAQRFVQKLEQEM